MISWIKIILCCLLGFFTVLLLSGCHEHFIGLLNPKGPVAYQERKLFFDTLALMLIVVLPVIVMSFTFVYHYQVSHRITDYKPNWGHSLFLEALWWGIPCVIIFILAVVTWKKTHDLDPYRQLQGQTQPLLIQVIALPWKWLFIYPEYGIATLNVMQLPKDREIEYWITADNVPMSAFCIPQLGSQIYAMAGMRTKLHIIPTVVGQYDGLNTQYNGFGFSDMHFAVNVVEQQEMQQWVDAVKRSTQSLDEATYEKLLIPTMDDKPVFYKLASNNIFQEVINRYLTTTGTTHPRNVGYLH